MRESGVILDDKGKGLAMRFAKWSVVLAGCVLVLSTVAMAQEQAGAASRRAARMENRQEEMAGKITAALDKLNLTADQKAQIDKLLAEHKTAIEALRPQLREATGQVRQANQAGDATAKAAAQAKLEPLMRQRMELGQKLHEAVKAILTPEQRATLKEHVAEAHPRLAGTLELGHVRQALRAANLTDDQKPKVKAIVEQAAADTKAATEAKAKREVVEKAVTQIETTVLTKDQVAKFQEALKEPLAPRGAASQPAK